MTMRLALGSLLISGGLLGVAHGCSSSSSGTTTNTDAGTDSSETGAADVLGCTLPPKPSQVPDGWTLYTDYDPCCLLYTPSAPQYLPPPLAWTMCNAGWSGDAGADGGTCRQIDAPSAGSPQYGEISIKAGVVTLLTTETVNGETVDVVAEADGPVHQAMMVTDRTFRCSPVAQDMRDGKFVYSVYPPNGSQGGGFIAGDVTESKPSLVHRFNDQLTHSAAVGALGVLDVDETDTFRLYAWNDTPQVIQNPQDVGLQYSFPFFSSNSLFWAATNATYLRVAEFTDAGATDFLSFGSDWSQGAGDLGSDGTDMVWIEANGRPDETSAFADASIMTAPFTTDSSKIVKRRLRSETPHGLSALPTTVGCGYAARSMDDGSGRIVGISLVRISDGTSWRLLNDIAGSWAWLHPLGITCDELFASVVTGPNTNNVARVNIASLGPGILAD